MPLPDNSPCVADPAKQPGDRPESAPPEQPKPIDVPEPPDHHPSPSEPPVIDPPPASPSPEIPPPIHS